MTLKEMLGLSGPEDDQPEVEEPEVETPAAPQPQFATVEQMQEMINATVQAQQENFVNLMRGAQQPQQTNQEPQYEEPSLDQIAEAYEEGDTKKALALQAQREQVREYRYQQQLHQLRNEGQGWVSNVNAQLAETSMPDYKKYKKDVAKKMDELGLPSNLRSDPTVIGLITNAVKGERIDEIMAERAEAAKRQENDAPTNAPSNGRMNPLNQQQEEVLDDSAFLALSRIGKDKDSFAKARGKTSWQEYEDDARAYSEYQRNPNTYVPKWKRGKK